MWPEILARINLAVELQFAIGFKFGGRYGIAIREYASGGLFDMRFSPVTFDLSRTHAVAVASDARLDILDFQIFLSAR